VCRVDDSHLRCLWAKSGTPPLALLTHFLDTAAVALEILHREPKRTRKLFAADLDLRTTAALCWVALFCGLHDLGKASWTFQRSWQCGKEKIEKLGLAWDDYFAEHLSHAVLTEAFVREALQKLGLAQGTVASRVATALASHHGTLPSPKERRLAFSDYSNREPKIWKQLRIRMVQILTDTLQVESPLKLANFGPIPGLRLMGLATLADWIASAEEFFPYGRDPLARDVFWQSQKLAERALDCLGWRRRKPLVVGPVPSFAQAFGGKFSPNALQEAVAELLKNCKGPILLLIEAPTGLGKTEAALYAHLVVQKIADHRGLYVALPTQATGNALFLRVREFLQNFARELDDVLDLQLQHGTAFLNPLYQKLRLEAEDAVRAEEWFSAKKRAMLSPYGVGTLDQALLGVLKVRHHYLRLWGLMNRTVVLDEIHAYDTYTSGLIFALLRWLRALDASVILMTATLTPSRRREILQNWGIQEPPTLPQYPRVLLVQGKETPEVQALSVPAPAKRVTLRPQNPATEAVAELLLQTLPGCVGAVVNTVDRAQALYQALGKGEPIRYGDIIASQKGHAVLDSPQMFVTFEATRTIVGKELRDGTKVFLLHARFPAGERAVREHLVNALFGKHGTRPDRAIVVSTQVIEQSLDLDFDVLYSDLAPIDLLLQRAGRLHRHQRDRPHQHNEPVLYLGLPPSPEFGPPLFWDKVYDEYILLSTWFTLHKRTGWTVPDDLEALLEEVYERHPHEFPPDLRMRAENAFENFKERCLQDSETAKNLALFDFEALLELGQRGEEAAAGLDDEAEDPKLLRLLTRLGDPGVNVVVTFQVGEKLYLDPEGKELVPMNDAITDKDAMLLWARSVRLSRNPIPQELFQEEAPSAWARHPLLRNLRVLVVGRTFGPWRVELDPELGIVYRNVD